MAGQRQNKKHAKRLRRVASIAELSERAIAPLVQRRGFATSELLTRWSDIVGAPFDKGVLPDKLSWPRHPENDASAGAVLTVRVNPAHALAFNHETGTIKAAINSYFGFYLVDRIKPGRHPFVPLHNDSREPGRLQPHTMSADEEKAIAREVDCIDNPKLRAALLRLGRGVKIRGQHTDSIDTFNT